MPAPAVICGKLSALRDRLTKTASAASIRSLHRAELFRPGGPRRVGSLPARVRALFSPLCSQSRAPPFAIVKCHARACDGALAKKPTNCYHLRQGTSDERIRERQGK